MHLADLVDETAFWPIELGRGQRLGLPRARQMFRAFQEAERHVLGELPPKTSDADTRDQSVLRNLWLARPLWMEWPIPAGDELPRLPFGSIDRRVGCLLVPEPSPRRGSADACVVVPADVGVALVLPVRVRVDGDGRVSAALRPGFPGQLDVYAVEIVRRAVPLLALCRTTDHAASHQEAAPLTAEADDPPARTPRG